MFPAAPVPLISGPATSASVFLYGTSGTPIVSEDLRSSDPDPLTAIAGWRFHTDGSVDKYTNGSLAEDNTGSPNDHWYTGNPTTVGETYYIRFTLDSGDAADNLSHTVGTWEALTSERYFFHDQSVGASGFFSRAGTYKVDIATDSGGTDIVDTGYYRYNIFISP